MVLTPGAPMFASMTYVRARYPHAEATVKGGTGEMGVLGTTVERWVVLSDSCTEAPLLGEGFSIEAAWDAAADTLRLAFDRFGRRKPAGRGR